MIIDIPGPSPGNQGKIDEHVKDKYPRGWICCNESTHATLLVLDGGFLRADEKSLQT
ncbi:hypothetical protein JXA70_19650 [candidate division KSB1 bacterium]|nr:hypothetical protein [candidate division KSB1 bacterium]